VQRRTRVASAGLAALALAAGGLIATTSPVAAQDDGPAAHFVVLGSQTGGLTTTIKSIQAAGGTVVKSWPQIGVVIAKSTSAEFAQSLRGDAGVQQVGASRALAELLPTTAQAVSTSEADKIESPTQKSDGVAERTAQVEQEPLAPNQWDMRLIKADAANQVSEGDPSIVVGVLDSGIDAAHPDLAPNIDAGNSVGCVNEGVPDTSAAAWAPTSSDHGTHVAGSIGAARNGVGIAGVAPDVRLASVKVVDDDGFIYPEYAICGFVWAAEHGIDVTNNSYFVDPWFRWCTDDLDQKAGYDAVKRAINYSAKKDVVNVAALGNSNWDLSKDVLDEGSPNNQEPISRVTDEDCFKIPAEVPGFVGVSSVGPTNAKSYFSNYGVGDTEVSAPGGDRFKTPNTPDGNGRVLSTIWPGGGWGYKQGTSMASPHAAGVVALIRSTHPEWSAKTVVAALQGQADRAACPANPYDPTGDGAWLATCEGGPTGRGFYGAGLVDALDAVNG